MFMLTDTASNHLLEECWITTDAEQLSSRFDREHFEITHTLAEHPLLQMPELMELAERTTKTRPDGIYYDAGDIKVDQRWDQMAALMTPVFASEDAKEGARAFAQKRPPVWQGR